MAIVSVHFSLSNFRVELVAHPSDKRPWFRVPCQLQCHPYLLLSPSRQPIQFYDPSVPVIMTEPLRIQTHFKFN